MTTLTCDAHKLFVGMSAGIIAIFNSETVDLLKCFSWHDKKIRNLLVLPKQIEPCICAETPFLDQDHVTVSSSSLEAQTTTPSLGANAKREGATEDFSSNECFVPNPDPYSVMVASVGNGKVGYSVQVQERSRAEEVVLLTWKS